MKPNSSVSKIRSFSDYLPATPASTAGGAGTYRPRTPEWEHQGRGRRIGKVTVTYHGTYILDIVGADNRLIETVEVSRKTGLPVHRH